MAGIGLLDGKPAVMAAIGVYLFVLHGPEKDVADGTRENQKDNAFHYVLRKLRATEETGCRDSGCEFMVPTLGCKPACRKVTTWSAAMAMARLYQPS